MQNNSSRPYPDDPRLAFEAGLLKALIVLYVVATILGY